MITSSCLFFPELKVMLSISKRLGKSIWICKNRKLWEKPPSNSIFIHLSSLSGFVSPPLRWAFLNSGSARHLSRRALFSLFLLPFLLPRILMRTRLDLPRGKGTFDWWRLDVGYPASNQTRFEVLQPSHHCSVGYQPSTTWLTSPRRFFLQVNRRTQARKSKHAIWNRRCVWSKNQDGVQALITKGLIATVVYNKNEGPRSL